ncbi:Transcription factor iws1 [Mycoemilia scoparia]|uniref:Transcription factor iws1 n=1 Tax=Mycoemilia scoparia TaxID=417184 RepID=A0A9W8A1W8_9FUNG|nr:Transcription factor iws1 [Mycoemilia scoparia]
MSDEQGIDYIPGENDGHVDSRVDSPANDGAEELFGDDFQNDDDQELEETAGASENAGSTETIVKSLPKFKRSSGKEPGKSKKQGHAEKRRRIDRNARGDESQMEPEDELKLEQPVDPKQLEIEEVNRQINAALKSGRAQRRRKGDDIDLDMDEVVQQFKDQMIKACERDHEDHQDRLPAIHKIQMLPLVNKELNKPDLYEVYLDNSILTAFRMWLEPFDDGSLPSIDIQSTLLELMLKMPIGTDHLRSSGVGKIVLFLSKCPRISIKNRRMAEQLVRNWSRPILRRSKDYRHRVATDVPATSRRPALDSEFQFGSVRAQSGGDLDGETFHARIPRPNALSYDIMPRSSITEADKQQMQQAKTNKYRLLKEKMLNRGTKR